jgi:hypothetical protein
MKEREERPSREKRGKELARRVMGLRAAQEQDGIRVDQHLESIEVVEAIGDLLDRALDSERTRFRKNPFVRTKGLVSRAHEMH